MRGRRARAGSSEGAAIGITSPGSGRCAPGWCACGVALVALERPDGLLIERLLGRGPGGGRGASQPGHGDAPALQRRGGKSDASTASSSPSSRAPTAIASGVLEPDSDQTKALRAITRARDASCAHGSRSPTSCAPSSPPSGPAPQRVLRRSTRRSRSRSCALPHPPRRPRFGRAATRRVPRRHGYSGRKPARELLARLRAGADGRAASSRPQPAARSCSRSSPRLSRSSSGSASSPSRSATRSIAPRRQTFRSLFIAPDSWLCAATMLAEIGDCRDRYPTYRALAADGGQRPVAVESGKSKHARFRWACDHRLRQAFCTLADSSRRHNPWAADIYHRARARGAITPTPPASSAAPGAKSSGASGTTTPPTTPPNTPPSKPSPQPEVDTGGC